MCGFYIALSLIDIIMLDLFIFRIFNSGCAFILRSGRRHCEWFVASTMHFMMMYTLRCNNGTLSSKWRLV
eukprot:m.503607 g.503607  ORF g.503607 m.503607 type:complete len:70 (-) comp21851_c0_seq1:22-231(-)